MWICWSTADLFELVQHFRGRRIHKEYETRWKNKNEAVTGFHHISLVSITDLGSLMLGYLGSLVTALGLLFAAFSFQRAILCRPCKRKQAICLVLPNRRLRCARNFIHIQLFITFILKAVAVFVKDAALFSSDDTNHCTLSTVRLTTLSSCSHTSSPFDTEYPISSSLFPPVSAGQFACKASVVFCHYCVMANFFWLLVEALYLNSLLLSSFCHTRRCLWGFSLLGWGENSHLSFLFFKFVCDVAWKSWRDFLFSTAVSMWLKMMFVFTLQAYRCSSSVCGLDPGCILKTQRVY